MFLASLTSDEWAALEADSQRLIRSDLTAWCVEALSPVDQIPARHHRLLISELQRVARGETDRLMIFMPPNSAKTTYGSILFVPWFMAQASNQHIIGASHASRYAEDLSGQVLRHIKNNQDVLGFGLLNEATDLWRTTNGCVYRAAGAGGSITGRRADLFLIDDPIKGRQDADSGTIRDNVWNWYRAEVLTRLNPGARIILIQTRWHEDDLAGRLLEEMKVGGDSWRIVNLPAIAEDEDALGRKPGEALWPERFSAESLSRTRIGVGEREWASLYQQRPRPNEGSLFRPGFITALETAPAVKTQVRAWDLAATAETGTRDPDWTVGLLLGKMDDGRFIVLDVVRARGDPADTEALLKATASQDGKGVLISLPQDPGQAGKAQVQYFTKQLAGYRIHSSPETGDKATRAGPMASQCNVGNLLMVKAAWNRTFIDELSGFPAGTKDDQVDALSRAFMVLSEARGPMRISQEAVDRAQRR